MSDPERAILTSESIKRVRRAIAWHEFTITTAAPSSRFAQMTGDIIVDIV